MLEELARPPLPSWTAYYSYEGNWRATCLRALEEHYGDQLDHVLEARFPQDKDFFSLRAGNGLPASQTNRDENR
jgi:hypothetical protein